MTSERERRRTLALALALSAGIHALAAMTLDLSPGPWQPGLAPALRLTLRPLPSAIGEAHAEGTVNARDATSGIAGERARPGSSVPLVPRYYRNREVDVQAVPTSSAPLVYPELAYVSKLQGTVRARIFISEEGVVESVQVVDAKPRRGVFEDAALEALRQVRYRPAEIGGARVKSQKLIEVKFNPYDEERPGVD
jgi:TonB family protein